MVLRASRLLKNVSMKNYSVVSVVNSCARFLVAMTSEKHEFQMSVVCNHATGSKLKKNKKPKMHPPKNLSIYLYQKSP